MCSAPASFQRRVDEIERFVCGFEVPFKREHVEFKRSFVRVSVWIDQLDAVRERLACPYGSFRAAINCFFNREQQMRQALDGCRVLA